MKLTRLNRAKKSKPATYSDMLQTSIAKVLKLDKKHIKVDKSDKSYKIQVTIPDIITKSHIQRLFKTFNKKNIKFHNISFGTELKTTNNKGKSTLSFELKPMKSTRKPKGLKMNRSSAVSVLAGSLAQNMRYRSVVDNIDKILVTSDGNGVKVMKAGDGARLINQIYQDYISNTDYTSFLDFFKAIDDLIFKFRGNRELDLTQLDDDEDEPKSRRRGKKPRKSFTVNPPIKVKPDDTPVEQPETDHSVVISKLLSKYYKE